MKFKNIFKVGIWTFFSRILGLFRDILLARYLGAGVISDAFFVALKIPNLFRKLFAEGSMQAAFIPIFSKLIHEDENKAKEFAHQVFSILFIVLLIFVLILEIFTPTLINIISPGFKSRGQDIFDLTVVLVRITLPYLFFISLASFYSSILNSLGKFALVAFLPALLNIAMIIATFCGGFFKNYENNYVIATSIGVFIGGFLQLFLVLYFSYKRKWLVGVKRIKKLSNDSKDFLKKLLPVLIGSGVYQVNIIIDVLVASLLPSGIISYLFYADRIYQLPLAIIGIAIATVLLPTISNKDKAKEEENHKTKELAFLLALGFSLFATVGLMMLANEIITAIFFGGAFLEEATHATAIVLLIYALSLPTNILIKIILPFYYAEGNTRLPLYSTMICLALNIILVFSLVKYFSYAGIAFATVIASYVNFLILLIYYQKKYGFAFSRNFFYEALKLILIALVMAVFLFITKELIFNDKNVMAIRFILFFVIVFSIGIVIIMLKLTKSVIFLNIFKKENFKKEKL